MKWLALAYDLLTILVFVLFVHALAGDGVELLLVSDRQGVATGVFLSVSKVESDPLHEVAEVDEILTVTKFERPFFAFLILLLVRLVATWRFAPEGFRARYRTRWGRLKPRLAICLLIGLLLLTVAELGFRRWWTAEAVTSVDLHTNAFGLRGPEVPPPGEGAARRTRVLFLGDSFTMGLGLAEDEMFLRRAEAALRDDGYRVDCINAAVGGFRTTDEVDLLVERFDEIRPDVVVLVFFINDAMPNHQVGASAQRMYRDLVLFRLSYDIYLSVVDPQFTPEHVAECYADGAPLWEEQKAALTRFRDLSEELGFAPLIVHFPLLKELDEYPFEAARKAVNGHVESLGVPLLDLTDAFRGQVERDLWLTPSDHHPNAEASRIVGEALAPWLDERLRELGIRATPGAG